jgi:parallel beta-helix repeat protein
MELKIKKSLSTLTIFLVVFAIFSSVMVCAPPALIFAQQETIIVTSTNDSGPGTLRQALLDAQSGDIIIFDLTVFPPNAPATIAVMSELPHIHQSNLTLDASQAGVILDGSYVTGEWVAGLQIVSSEANTIWGLQISHFPGPGIAISGDAKHNIIGGDRSLGVGPFGRGNLFSNNQIGVDLATSGTTLNTVTGNLIGTDTEGVDKLGNYYDGVSIAEGAHHNTIGPDNIIAYNNVIGIEIHDSNSFGNTITQNSIHDNVYPGIYLWKGGNTELLAPLIFDFDLAAGTVTGTACSNCIVEIFSDKTSEGEIYEGRTIADDLGVFTFNKGVSLNGPHLTATTTDADGDTSQFSVPTLGSSRSTVLQEGNNLLKTRLQPKQSEELEDNRIGTGAAFERRSHGTDASAYLDQVNNIGQKWILGLTIDWLEWDPVEVNGEYSIYYIDPTHDEAVTGLVDLGIETVYSLAFWDEEIQPEEDYARFKKEEEIQRYLDYVQFIVHNFKDRIQYYEMINEPRFNEGGPFNQQNIELVDYIELVRRTVQVIRQEYPEAKIVVGATVLFYEHDYLLGILESDIMPLVDGVSWHPFYGQSPEYQPEYYYNYSSIVQEIKDVASAHGFEGEYMAGELSWGVGYPTFPWTYGEIVTAKYYARGIIMHLGLDVIVGFAGGNEPGEEQRSKFRVIRNLCTIMAGAEPASLPVDMQSEATNIRSYSFSLTNGDKLIALWTDGVAVDEDSGVKANLTFQGFIDRDVMGIDVLNGFQQPLVTSSENGNLIISNLMVRDYPLILRLEQQKQSKATIDTCDSMALNRNVFNLTETVYVKGTGYSSSVTYGFFVVNDVASWSDGMEIPARILGTASTVSSDSSGNIPPTAIWNASLNLGKYDIVVDFDGNGLYDEEIDALDNDDIEVTAGFVAIPELSSIMFISSFIIATVAVLVHGKKPSKK